jgi:hypothetical protein
MPVHKNSQMVISKLRLLFTGYVLYLVYNFVLKLYKQGA